MVPLPGTTTMMHYASCCNTCNQCVVAWLPIKTVLRPQNVKGYISSTETTKRITYKSKSQKYASYYGGTLAQNQHHHTEQPFSSFSECVSLIPWRKRHKTIFSNVINLLKDLLNLFLFLMVLHFVPHGKFGPPYPDTAQLLQVQRQLLLSICAVFSCVKTTLPAFEILNMRTDTDACDCTRGL